MQHKNLDKFYIHTVAELKMFSKTEEFKMNLLDRIVVQKSFNPPSSFQTSAKDKYGKNRDDGSMSSQEIFNEDCTQGVELVVDTIRKLRTAGPLDLDSTKNALKKLLGQLAAIRKDTADKTGTLDSEQFGRSRKENPVCYEGQHIIDITRIYNPQHLAAHEEIKKLLKGYIGSIIKESNKKSFGYQAMACDSKEEPKSRYVISVYTQKRIVFTPKNDKEASITLDVNADNMPKLIDLASNSNYTFRAEYDCSDDLLHIFTLIANEFPQYNKKNILVGEIQLKIDGKFIPATRHVSWLNEFASEFERESKIVLQHTRAEYHEEIFNQTAALWFAAISWDETKSDFATLDSIMADLQFYFSQALFYYRGGPTISKMLLRGTYYEQGFLVRQTTGSIDEYCTGEYYPFMTQHRKKFISCFTQAPTSERTKEFIFEQGRFEDKIKTETSLTLVTDESYVGM
ncbi:hypothetical protein [Legionella sp.]|uniref:hypothetical protein n=1 Tax=Legionella sp. TaxID=459 RepID=UPI0032208E1F